MTELSEMFSAGICGPGTRCKLCSETPEVRILGGATVRTAYGLDDLAAADTVVIPSVRDVAAPTSPDSSTRSERPTTLRRRVVSICSGAFALAAAGVLDGRRATTHWIYVDLLQQQLSRYRHRPGAALRRQRPGADQRGVRGGPGSLPAHRALRSRGAGCQRRGPAVGGLAAPRGWSGAVHRDPVPEPAADGRIAAGMAWALANLDRPITLDELAAQSAMSRRSYLRQFAKATGTTPIKWLIAQRIQASLRAARINCVLDRADRRAGRIRVARRPTGITSSARCAPHPATTAVPSTGREVYLTPPSGLHNGRVTEGFTESFTAAWHGYGDRQCIEFDGPLVFGPRGRSLRDAIAALLGAA